MSDFATDCPTVRRLSQILPDAVNETLDFLSHAQDAKLREQVESLRDTLYKASVILNRLLGPEEWLRDRARPA